MKKQNVTLNDVAETVGVSMATVSRVVNNYPHVSEKVRKKVQKAIEDMGYNPHIAARSLASKRTGNIGLVIPNSIHNFFTDPYFPRLTDGIANACNENDYTLSLFLFHTPELEKKLIPRLTRGGLVDGIIVQATGIDDNILDNISQGSVPFVVAGTPMNQAQVNYIDVDNVTGARYAVEHLIRLGRRQIATITGPLTTAAGIDRLEGYRLALSNNGISVENRLIASGDFSEESGYSGAKQLLNQKGIDALFVASDTMAAGALRVLRELEVSIPSDIAVVGYDDLPPARLSTPALTTVSQPIKRFGVQAMEILMKVLKDRQLPPQQIILGTSLIIRESCGGA